MMRGWIAYSHIMRRISGRRRGKSVNVVGMDMAFCYELERPSVVCEIFGIVEVGVREVKLGRFDRVCLLLRGRCPAEVHAGCGRSVSQPLICSGFELKIVNEIA